MADIHMQRELEFRIAIYRLDDGTLAGAARAVLPGVEPTSYMWRAGVTCVDELAAFNDDVLHCLRVERLMIEAALEDITRPADASLF